MVLMFSKGTICRYVLSVFWLIPVLACDFESHASDLEEAWDLRNDPSAFQIPLANLQDLPLEGRVADDRYPWAGDYWPTYGGGIARRWRLGNTSTQYRSHLYLVHNEETLTATPNFDVSKLSPAEKFDLYMNRYDFPLTKSELAKMLRTVKSDTDSIPTWYGLCHGWAPAAIMEREPGPVVTVKNASGMEIPFYTADLEALLTHIYAHAGGADRFIGTRCNVEDHAIATDAAGRVVKSECRDTNPGSFHLALTHLLGVADPAQRQSFIMDVAYSAKVWNHPIVGFKVESIDVKPILPADDPLQAVRAPGTRQLAALKVRVYYVNEIRARDEPVMANPEDFTASKIFDYTLELDGAGKIIGGEWNGEQRPDFIWMMTGKPKGTNLLPYDKVAELVALSRTETPAEPTPTPAEPLPDPDATPTSPADSGAVFDEAVLTPAELAVPFVPVPGY